MGSGINRLLQTATQVAKFAIVDQPATLCATKLSPTSKCQGAANPRTATTMGHQSNQAPLGLELISRTFSRLERFYILIDHMARSMQPSYGDKGTATGASH